MLSGAKIGGIIGGILVVFIILVSALLFYKMRGKKHGTKWDVQEVDSGRVMGLVLTNGAQENIPGGRVRSMNSGGDL
jgi:hypothetical protein